MMSRCRRCKVGCGVDRSHSVDAHIGPPVICPDRVDALHSHMRVIDSLLYSNLIPGVQASGPPVIYPV